MAVKLRLRRLGRKKRPFYRIIAADSRAPRDGRFIEEIGNYNPLTEPATVEVKEDRVLYWLGVGATPSKTVRNILSRQGIILKFDLRKQGLPEEKISEELKRWEVLQLERNRRLEARKLEEKERKKKTREEAALAAEETEAATAGSRKDKAPEPAPAVEETAPPAEAAAAAEETPESTVETETPGETVEVRSDTPEEKDVSAEDDQKDDDKN